MISQKEFEKVLRNLRKKTSTDSFLNELLSDEEIILPKEPDDNLHIKIPYVNASPIAEAKWL